MFLFLLYFVVYTSILRFPLLFSYVSHILVLVLGGLRV